MTRGKLSTSTHVLIGAGNMGGALLNGWLNGSGPNGLGGAKLEPHEILIIDPSPGEAAEKALELGAKYATGLTKGSASGLKLCLLAIKPQMFAEVGEGLANALPSDVLIISIMAGISLETLGEVFGTRPVIRAMPNTPAAFGKGITAFVGGVGVTQTHKILARTRLKAGGKVLEVETERQIDMVTAVSGSGPAYVFVLTEAMAAAGVQLGLPEALAKELARETVIGSGYMLDKNDHEVSDLRRAVTSPGGTTEAALEVLMSDNGLPSVMRKAVNAAFARSRELGSRKT